jgi:ABC-2 type transport system permease protein
MRKIWFVLKFEYARHVFRKRFLIGLFSLPLLIGIMALVVFVMVRPYFNFKPVGYVDESGLLKDPESLAGGEFQNSQVELISFDDEGKAQDALNAGQIQAYYVLQADYLETRGTKLVSLDDPSGIAASEFGRFVRVNLLLDFPSEIIRRVTEGSQLVLRSTDGSRQFIEGDWLGFLLPFLVGFIFLISVFATSGYLLQAVVEEKENLTMEMLVTAISPSKMMTGKILGIVGIGLTQLLVWFGLALLLLLLTSMFVDFSTWIALSLNYLALAVVLFIPAFVLVSSLMVAVGATLTDVQEAQQVTSLFTLPLFLPFWFAFQIINNPDGYVAVGLSLFPFTAPIAMAIRTGFADVPQWQIGLSLGLLICCAIFAVWFAGRAFRLGMLRYGQRVPWREFLGITGNGGSE